MKKEPIEAWAILFPDNHILVDSNFVTEEMAWRVALGWPDNYEIERAKKNGHRAMRLKIDVNEQTAKPVEHHETKNMNDNDGIPGECESLCRAAEALQSAANELWRAENPDELSEGDKAMEPEDARDLHKHAWRSLTAAIYYMRKRMGALK